MIALLYQEDFLTNRAIQNQDSFSVVKNNSDIQRDARLVKRAVERFKHEDMLDNIRFTITVTVTAPLLRVYVGMQ